MNFFDYWTDHPLDELQSAWNRIPHNEYVEIGSLKGRAVCVLKIFSHTASFVIKPIVYLVTGVALMTIQSFIISINNQKPDPDEFRFHVFYLGANLILTAIVAPIGQVFQIFKATLGVLHPVCYFKKDELHPYFIKLANIAEELECETEFVEMIKNGSQIINKNLYFSSSRSYYYALFENNLFIICDQLASSQIPDDQKRAILDMLAPLPDNFDVTGINACSPGLGRILEQMRYCLDVPHDPEQIIPWLEALYKMNIFNLMAMQSDTVDKYWTSIFVGKEKELSEKKEELPMTASHFANVLIVNLGPQTGLSKNMIEIASHDPANSYRSLTQEDKKELLAIYHDLYSEGDYMDYLANHINSQPNGEIGLKPFRDYIIQTLCENISEEEIASSQQEVQEQFSLSDILADDPIYYVKFHYFLYPDVDPSDERSTDLNEEGIRLFLDIVQPKE